MKKIIEDLIKFNINLIGSGYDNAIEYIKHLIKLDVIEIPSGTKLETWTVPDEWVAKEAWVKFNGVTIFEWKNDLSLMVYSQPFNGMVTRDELKKHLYTLKDYPDAIPYEYSFYEKKWGFCVPHNKMFDKDGKDLLQEGEYEVHIDTEFKPGTMKIGVHTVKGKTDREILLFAHLDHPYQANDNLSGVACLVDLANRLKDKYKHTIKIVFCPETIGSIGYAMTQDISKVDFMIAVDICGNNNSPTLQWSFDGEDRLNRLGHLAMMQNDEDFMMNQWRAIIGSDEYVFNDPLIGIPGLLLTRYPYREYHSSMDTIEIIDEQKIKNIQNIIEQIITFYETDFIPVRKFKGPLMRSKYELQTPIKSLNLQLDYLIYNIDGKRWFSEIVDSLALNFSYCLGVIDKLEKDGLIEKKYGTENRRVNVGKKKQRKVKK